MPLLQPLLRGSDPRVTQAAVRALSNINDPAAARAVHTVLRAATGEQRRAVVEALVAERDPRVVPVLVRILDESDAARRAITRSCSRRSARVGAARRRPGGARASTRDAEEEAGSRGKKVRALKTASLDGAAARSARRPRRRRSRTRQATATGCCGSSRARRRPRRVADTCDAKTYDELVRRLAAAIRGATLYSPDHPLVQRGVDALTALCTTALAEDRHHRRSAFIGDEVVVNGERLPESAAALVGFARDMREREIEKITIARGVTRDELRAFIFELADRRAAGCRWPTRLQQKGVRRITIGRHHARAETTTEPTGIAAARRVYGSAVETARVAVGQARQAGRQAGPERRAQDHRQPREAGRRGTAPR